MNRIKELRKANGYSQEKLASILSVHQTAISQWETGRTLPDIELAHRIARLFSVSIDYLLGLEEEGEKITFQEVSITPNRLRELRQSHNLTQAQLAEKLNVAQNTLSYWESGKTDIGNDALLELSDIFNTSTDYILGREEKKTAPNELSLSPEQQNLITSVSELSQDDVKKTLEYVEFLRSKQNP